MNPYDKLGVPRGASQDDVKKAYRDLAQKHQNDTDTPSPLREQNDAEMQQINEAFDQIIADMKTGGSTQFSSEGYEQIRQLINAGNADMALSQLNSMGTLSNDAEWNFLMGSAYYYKGWANQATSYFETATNLNPQNREYNVAFENIKRNAAGNMHGSPYGNMNNPYQSNMSSCGPCDMCGALLCANMCCGCGRGGCC